MKTKSTIKVIGASVLALTLAMCGYGDWWQSSYRNSAERSRFSPRVTRDARAVLGVNLDKEQVLRAVDLYADRVCTIAKLDASTRTMVKEKIAAYKQDVFADVPADGRRYLEECGLCDANFRWAVVSLESITYEGAVPHVEGLSVALAGQFDFEKFILFVQRKASEKDDDSVSFWKVAVRGEEAWRLVPKDSSLAREWREAGFDPHVTSLDGQLVLASSSRDALAKQIRLYRTGEGSGDALGDFSARRGELLHLTLPGIREFVPQSLVPGDWLLFEGLELDLTLSPAGKVSEALRVRDGSATILTPAILMAAMFPAISRAIQNAKPENVAPEKKTTLSRSPSRSESRYESKVESSEDANDSKTELDKGKGDSFATACANEILDRLGTRTWLITDGQLDAYLRRVAAARGKELYIISLKLRTDAEDKTYRDMIANLVKANKVCTEDAELRDDLSFKLREVGLLDFLKKWFKSDPNITSKVAVVGWPDFWFWAGCRPVPEGLFFGGVKDEKSVDGPKLKADFEAFWKKVEPVLVSDRRKGSRAIREASDPIEIQRLALRRHCGLIANNLGVLLQHLGHDAEAYDMYELVLGTIDSDNVCALLNVYEMFRSGAKKEPVARRQEVEQQLNDLVADQSRRYNLRPLSSYYGYIRSPEIFKALGLNWARSGEMGYALSPLDLVPGGGPSEALLHEVASIYAQSGQTMKAREVYEKTLEKDATNHEALMGLWLLSIRAGDFDKAKDYLTRAVKVSMKEGAVRMDTALLLMMNNRLDEARDELARITYLYPNSIQGWVLRAFVVLQQADGVADVKKRQEILAQIDNEILPKIEKLAPSPRDFRVQMLRAFMLMRRGNDEDSLKKARSALEIVWMGRADTSVGAMVLNLDCRLLDRQSAERHALQILRLDENHPYANWVMGSIRMEEGKMPEAEKYLRVSVSAARPPAVAQNDLAELLRKDGRLAEAETFARAGTQNDPKLYVVWETLCATLLDQNKNLNEAEQCIQKAIDLSKGTDIRMQLTLARVQIAKGNIVQARATLRELGNRSDELSESNRAVFEGLLQQIK